MSFGTVFDIQKFSVHDGPGIRTAVFLKGCPLKCIWCHNPESWHPYPEILFNLDKCTGCGRCVAACPHHCHHLSADGKHTFERSACVGCGACANGCFNGALELCGKPRSVEEVMEAVLKDVPFYENSGGGLTVSGGEPMAQYDFTHALLTAAKANNLHVCMETCGFAPRAHYEEIMPLVDIFLFDIKTTNCDKHRQLTGQDNTLIHENLRLLNERGAHIILRCPLVPGVNDSDAELQGIADLANSLAHVDEVNIEPYHPFGTSKARHLGITDSFEAPMTPETQWKSWLTKLSKLCRVPVKKP